MMRNSYNLDATRTAVGVHRRDHILTSHTVGMVQNDTYGQREVLYIAS
jgi:hypothetical protein